MSCRKGLILTVETTPTTQQRRAERIRLPQPVPAMLGELLSRLVEVSLIGCRLEHADRVEMRAVLPLRFHWQGEEIVLRATVMRSELQMVEGKMTRVSGLQFCTTVEDSPAAVRRILNSLLEPKPAAPAMPTRVPFLRLDDEVPEGGTFLECSFENGRWRRMHIAELRHPRNGFTVPLPVADGELDSLCRAYEEVDDAARARMRAKIDLLVAQTRARR
jgi:PilZ domain-containing protein